MISPVSLNHFIEYSLLYPKNSKNSSAEIYYWEIHLGAKTAGFHTMILARYTCDLDFTQVNKRESIWQWRLQ